MEAFWVFYQSPRAEFMDKPKTRTHLWYGFASEVGSWELQGQGAWAIETADGEIAGQVAVTQPPHFPEPELGWILFDGFEGRGLAFEAASAALEFARSKIRPASLVSYIDRRNVRSIALAKRLGGVEDTVADRFDDNDMVIRHDMRQAA